MTLPLKSRVSRMLVGAASAVAAAKNRLSPITPDRNPSQRYLKFGRCGSNALAKDGRAALPRRPKYLRDKSTRFRALESNRNRNRPTPKRLRLGARTSAFVRAWLRWSVALPGAWV